MGLSEHEWGFQAPAQLRKGEAGAWNHDRAVAAEEQKSDNRGLELCDPEKVA